MHWRKPVHNLKFHELLFFHFQSKASSVTDLSYIEKILDIRKHSLTNIYDLSS